MAAAILGVLAVLFIGYRLFSIFGGSGSPEATANASPAGTPVTATRTMPPRHSSTRRPAASAGKKVTPAPSLDPTLKLSLLA
jgi:hypothetical protein